MSSIVTPSPYDRLYAAMPDNILWPSRPGRLVRRLSNWLPPGSSVLDAGCGDGKNALHLQRLGYRCKGFDSSRLALSGLVNRFRRGGLTPTDRFVLDSLETYRVEESSVDCLLSYGLLHCVESSHRAEIHRRLCDCVRPGGFLLFTALIDTLPLPAYHGTPGIRLVTHDEVAALLRPGWRILESTDGVIDEDHPPLVPRHLHGAIWLVAERKT